MARRRPRTPEWVNWPDERLLDLRLCELGVSIEGSWVEPHIEQVLGELEQRQIAFKPHFWLSDDWFTPDGIPGVALPFYVAHPRLMKLELAQMLEVEGGNAGWCVRILRHEAGHAIDNAFRLRRRRHRQQLFGKSSEPYPTYYQPRPYSKRFVLHLDSWYAQSHPDEDFAETFAVWLNPRSMWRKRYSGWPALRKLEYMNKLMTEIAGTKATIRTRRRLDSLVSLRKTLREHYSEKRALYGLDYPNFYDRDLLRLFSDAPQFAKSRTAASFLRQQRPQVRRQVGNWTSTYQYTIDQVLAEIIERCQELDLRLTKSEEETLLDFTILLTVQTMNYLHSGRHRLAL